jgi:DNA-binding response OmpR family regulator
MKLLVVDDNADVRHSYAVALPLLARPPVSLAVDEAESLDAARVYLAANTPDAVLLDLNLGDSRGTATVRAVASLTESPIVVVTGSMPDAEQESILAGAAEFVLKGGTPAEVWHLIWRAVWRAQAARDLRPIREHLDRAAQKLTLATALAAGPPAP